MEKGLAPFIAEFVGTFVLVFTIGCSLAAHTALGEETVASNWMGVCVSVGCALMAMTYAFDGSSGANFNPAVSVALGLCRKLPWETVGIYSFVQVAAALCAGIACRLMYGDEPFGKAQGTSTWHWRGGVVEMIYTFMLCFIVLNTVASKKHGGKNQFYGIAIGFCMIAGAYAVGISGGFFNPAVVVGVGIHKGRDFYVVQQYILMQIAGVALAVLMFKLVRPEENNDSDAPHRKKISEVVSEFIGTYMVVLTVGLAEKSHVGALSIAAALACMTFAVGSVSGGHFNPAVTLATLLSGRSILGWEDALEYVASQLAAGIAGGFTYMWLESGGFPLMPNQSGLLHIVGLFIAEFVFTFVLVLVVLTVSTTKRNGPGPTSYLSEYMGLAIGMCVVISAFVSSFPLNPAVALGILSASSERTADIAWVLLHSTIELLAGVFAFLVFRVTRPSEYQVEHETYKPYKRLASQ